MFPPQARCCSPRRSRRREAAGGHGPTVGCSRVDDDLQDLVQQVFALDNELPPATMCLVRRRRRLIVRNETTATARWALLFIFRAFVNVSITVAVWTSFHVCTPRLPMLISNDWMLCSPVGQARGIRAVDHRFGNAPYRPSASVHGVCRSAGIIRTSIAEKIEVIEYWRTDVDGVTQTTKAR